MNSKVTTVEGENKGSVMLFALSTCVWCKKTKKFLNELGIRYKYVDVDKLDVNEKADTMNELSRFNPRCSFPTLVVDDEKCIVGYDAVKIKESLGK